MPLEISEIGIRLAIADGVIQDAAAGGGTPGPAGMRGPLDEAAVEEIVQKVVRRVLESLRYHEAR